MARFKGKIQPGDVVLARTGHFASLMIRLGAAFTDRPNLVNHALVAHHYDDAGTLWGIEGRTGGVGWVDVSKYTDSKYINANVEQPKSIEQRSIVCNLAVQMLGTPYDWTAIVENAVHALHLDKLWHAKEFGDKQIPGQVICSSFADWCYEQASLASPGNNDGTRFTTPADWDAFIMEEGWLDESG